MTARQFAARIGHERLRRLLLTTVVGYGLVLVVVGIAACLGGCGSATTVSGGAACSSLMLLIGERRDYEPARTIADIETVSEVCRRLAAPPAVDAGTP